jgi:outer membrane protein, multidrug efflux system
MRYYSLAHCALFCVLISLGGCTRYRLSQPSQAPERFTEHPFDEQAGADSSGAPLPTPPLEASEPWWVSFQDEQLNDVMRQLFDQNLQLKQAQERVTQMRAIASQMGSQRWPSLNLDLGWSRSKQLNPFARLSGSAPSAGSTMMTGGAMAGGGAPEDFTQDTFKASLSVSYEIDVWGRLGSQTEAAERDAIASEEDLTAMAITLSASAVDVWLQLIEQGARREVIRAQFHDDETQLALVVDRFNQGLAPHVEVLQQTQQRDRTRAQIPLVDARGAQLRRRLAALQGHALPRGLEIPKALPRLPRLPKLGLPMEVLFKRPDLRAAQARLTAADARVSAALSARLPALRLGASIGAQSFEASELLDQWVWSLSSNLLTPLFQAGRLKAEQTRQEAILRERVHALSERVIIAYHEVENAITLERQQRVQLDALDAQYTSANALFESAQDRYLEGVGDFFTVLTARQGLFSVTLSRLIAQRALLSYRVQLHRALGGRWSTSSSSDAQTGEN